jgi:hypothetical protein
LGGHAPTYDDKVAQNVAMHKQKCAFMEYGRASVTLAQQLARRTSPLSGGGPSG